MQTRPRLKILLLFLIAFICATAISYFASIHYHVKSSLMTGLNGRETISVKERHHYNIHGWEGFELMRSTEKAKRIFYNRVGKCGSRTMIQLMISLAQKHKYTVIGSNENHFLHMNLRQQIDLVDFIDRLEAPFIYHQHVHFIDFERLGVTQPIYINVIRDPLARLVSQYYFRRFGDYREGQRTWSFRGTEEQKNMTFDECVLNEMPECVDPGRNFYIVPYFCGQEAFCRRHSELALKQAKINVIKNYLVVGVTEELEDFLSVLEKLLPEFFEGVLEIYRTPDDELNTKMRTTKTMNKKGPSPEVQEIMKKHLELEYDFYNFVKQRFQRLKAELS